MYKLIYIALVLVLVSCGDQHQENNTETAAQPVETTDDEARYILSEVGIALHAPIPEWMADGTMPEIQKNSASGVVTITYSPDLVANIAPDPRSIEQMKEELRQHDVFEVVILDEGSESLLYEYKIPSGESVGVSYLRTVAVNDQSYHIVSDPNIELTLDEARQLAQAINSLLVIQ